MLYKLEKMLDNYEEMTIFTPEKVGFSVRGTVYTLMQFTQYTPNFFGWFTKYAISAELKKPNVLCSSMVK